MRLTAAMRFQASAQKYQCKKAQQRLGFLTLRATLNRICQITDRSLKKIPWRCLDLWNCARLEWFERWLWIWPSREYLWSGRHPRWWFRDLYHCCASSRNGCRLLHDRVLPCLRDRFQRSFHFRCALPYHLHDHPHVRRRCHRHRRHLWRRQNPSGIGQRARMPSTRVPMHKQRQQEGVFSFFIRIQRRGGS